MLALFTQTVAFATYSASLDLFLMFNPIKLRTREKKELKTKAENLARIMDAELPSPIV